MTQTAKQMEAAAADATEGVARPLTGKEFLDSLHDDREVWIYGERVSDVTSHPAFRNSARMLARMYDALHDPEVQPRLTTETDTGNGGLTHTFYKVPRSPQDLVGSRDAIAEWARISYGWMGRSPDYKASLTGTLGANAEFYAPYHENAQRWYRETQERCLFLNHALVNPPMDKDKAPRRSQRRLRARGEGDRRGRRGERRQGRGDRLGADPPQLHRFLRPHAAEQPRHGTVRHDSHAQPRGEAHLPAVLRTARRDAGQPVRLSAVLAPGRERRDPDLGQGARAVGEPVRVSRPGQGQQLLSRLGFIPRFAMHGCTRFAVKLDFLAGVMLKALDALGIREQRSAQVQIGEVLSWRHTFWALTEAMCKTPEQWTGGALQPSTEYGVAYRVLAPVAYPRVKEIIEQTISSGLIYLNSHAVDFKTPELRPYLDKYLRGSGDYDALERVKLLKLLWDAVGSEFGGRHELYERNYAGNYEKIKIETAQAAQAMGRAEELTALVDRCLAEYDLDGWTVPDLIDPDDVNRFTRETEK